MKYKLPRHIRLAYLVELALRKLSRSKNTVKALNRHAKLVKELKLDLIQEDFKGFWVNGKLIDLSTNRRKYG